MQFGDFMHSSTLFGIRFFCVSYLKVGLFLLSISRCLVTRSAQISEKKMTIWINFLHIYSLSNTFMNKSFWFYRHIFTFEFKYCVPNFTTPLSKYVMCRLQKNGITPCKCIVDKWREKISIRKNVKLNLAYFPFLTFVADSSCGRFSFHRGSCYSKYKRIRGMRTMTIVTTPLCSSLLIITFFVYFWGLHIKLLVQQRKGKKEFREQNNETWKGYLNTFYNENSVECAISQKKAGK